MPNPIFNQQTVNQIRPFTRTEKILAENNLTPRTREEKIISGEDIEPMTRAEYFLKKRIESFGVASTGDALAGRVKLKFQRSQEVLSGISVEVAGVFPSDDGYATDIRSFDPVKLNGTFMPYPAGANLVVPTFASDEGNYLDCYISLQSITTAANNIVYTVSCPDADTFERMRNRTGENALVWHIVTPVGVTECELVINYYKQQSS